MGHSYLTPRAKLSPRPGREARGRQTRGTGSIFLFFFFYFFYKRGERKKSFSFGTAFRLSWLCLVDILAFIDRELVFESGFSIGRL